MSSDLLVANKHSCWINIEWHSMRLPSFVPCKQFHSATQSALSAWPISYSAAPQYMIWLQCHLRHWIISCPSLPGAVNIGQMRVGHHSGAEWTIKNGDQGSYLNKAALHRGSELKSYICTITCRAITIAAAGSPTVRALPWNSKRGLQ